jgi:hypothetical protein
MHIRCIIAPVSTDLPPWLEGQIPSTWTGEGNVWAGRGTDGSVTVHWSLGRPDGRRGELRVWFDPEVGHRVSAVHLSLPDGLTPSGLGRFPWARWLTVADAARHFMDSDVPLDPRIIETPESMAFANAVESARAGKRPPRGSSSSRPGRRGHPDSHYQEIARRYLALRQRGFRNPTARLAEEDRVSRSTAAGWVGGARKRGYLPPGRPGRAG